MEVVEGAELAQALPINHSSRVTDFPTWQLNDWLMFAWHTSIGSNNFSLVLAMFASLIYFTIRYFPLKNQLVVARGRVAIAQRNCDCFQGNNTPGTRWDFSSS